MENMRLENRSSEGNRLNEKPEPSKAGRLLRLLEKNEYLTAPCAFDALSAKAIEAAGFQLAGTTGQGLHATLIGQPDNGLLAFNEMVEACEKIASAIRIPLLCDAEGGYGNALSVTRTVREFERAGAAGIFIEDQKLPPNCPFIRQVQLISQEEMVGKLRAAVETRTDPDFLIVARTDAPFEEAVERAHAYLEAGADMIKPIPKSERELMLWPEKVKAPLHVGFMTGNYIRPDSGMTCHDVGKMGYKIITFPINLLLAVTKTMQDYLSELMRTGSDAGYFDRMLPFGEFQEFIGMDEYIRIQEEFIRD